LNQTSATAPDLDNGSRTKDTNKISVAFKDINTALEPRVTANGITSSDAARGEVERRLSS
jgi:hypothetical protein